ncbi:hypothetical protein BH09ACT9_BH09ACT9_19570 [soil metagenome]
MKTHMPMRGFAAAGEGNVLYRSDICGVRSDRTRSLFGTALAAATLGASVITGCASTQGVVIEGDVASTGLPVTQPADLARRVAENSRLGRALLDDPGVSEGVKTELRSCPDWYPISVGSILLDPGAPRIVPETELVVMNVYPCQPAHQPGTGVSISVNLAGYVYRSGKAGSSEDNPELGERLFSVEERGKFIVSGQRAASLSVLETDPRPPEFECCPRPPLRTEFHWDGMEFIRD